MPQGKIPRLAGKKIEKGGFPGLRCEVCGEEVLMPFKCRYCGGYFCVEHRLPEKHDCPGLFAAASPYEKELKEARAEARKVEEKTAPQASGGGEGLHLLAGTVLVVLAGLSLIGYRLDLPYWVIAALLGGFAASFLIHELAHRVTARRYGLPARFKIDPMGALLTLLTSIPFIPIKIIAPGAVVIPGFMTPSMLGWTALWGPLTNIILSIGFLNLYYLTLGSAIIYLPYIFRVLASINALLAFFNLIPFGPLDGRKVIAWSLWRWVIAMVVSIILLIVTRVV